MNAQSNMVTIDIEDWYHICDTENIMPRSLWDQCESRIKINTDKILNALRTRNVRATFFVLGYIAERYPDMIQMIGREGHEIASHGYSHVQSYKQSPDEFREDLFKSKKIIEAITGRPIGGYRAPEWSIGKRNSADQKALSMHALATLTELGFAYDSSIAPLRIIGAHGAPISPYIIRTSHGTIVELPPLVMKTFMGNIPIGGGWGLRIISLRDIRKTIQRFNNAHKPAVIYIHPWEIDEDLPRMKLPLSKRFVCYAAVQNTWPKFLELLDIFEFTSIKEALSKLNYNHLPVYAPDAL